MSKRIVAWALLAGVTLTQAGCLVGAHSKESQSGSYVPAATFEQITPGVTAGFVQATLGNPDSRTPVKDDGSEIWRWAYTEKKQSSGYLFLIFGGSNEKETKHAAYVQMKDGAVVKAWRG